MKCSKFVIILKLIQESIVLRKTTSLCLTNTIPIAQGLRGFSPDCGVPPWSHDTADRQQPTGKDVRVLEQMGAPDVMALGQGKSF